MKICTKCKLEKSDIEFSPKLPRCKVCVATQKREYNHRIGKSKNYKGDPRDDLSGKIYGSLKVIKWTRVENNHFRYWLCKCACGNEVEVIHSDLTGLRIKSCGCRRKRKGDENHLWKGHGEISGSCWSKIKQAAKVRNLVFDVTIEHAWDLFLKQSRKCALSGLDLIFCSLGSGSLHTASLDRIDSDKNYIIGNIQWVHKDVNYMKNNFNELYFIEVCKKIADKNKE